MASQPGGSGGTSQLCNFHRPVSCLHTVRPLTQRFISGGYKAVNLFPPLYGSSGVMWMFISVLLLNGKTNWFSSGSWILTSSLPLAFQVRSSSLTERTELIASTVASFCGRVGEFSKRSLVLSARCNLIPSRETWHEKSLTSSDANAHSRQPAIRKDLNRY